MALRGTFVAGAAMALSGCAAVPASPRADGIEVEKIVDAVQCELASVYKQNPRRADSLRDWLARATLELKVTNDAAFAPTVTAIPVIQSGALKVPIGPDLQDQSIRTATITFDVRMADLKPAPSGRAGAKMPNCAYAYTGLPEAYETLGLGDWLSTLAESAGREDYATLHEAAYNLEFTVVRGLHGGVSFVGAHVEVDATGATAKKTNYNHLVVAFTYDPPAKAGTAKAKASVGASQRLDLQIQRFLPQRFNLQPGSGIIIR
jgi:hypothetical protein